jgi:hypothetical protein
MDMSNKKIKNSKKQENNWQTINKGKPIYYKEVQHWIVYEFEDMMLIATNEDLTGVFSVSKKQITYK